VLAEARAIDGVVQDEQGSPVAGALVLAGDRTSVGDVILPESATDAEGRFHLAGIPRAEGSVSAFAAGFAPMQSLAVPLDQESVTITLRHTATGTLHVVARGLDARPPPPGVRVSLSSNSDHYERLPSSWSMLELDANGEATLSGLPAGLYQLRAFGPSCGFIEDRTQVTFAAGEEQTVTFAAIVPLAMSGRVTLEDGTPVRGQTLEVQRFGATTVTGEDGRFTLACPVTSAGRIELALRGGEYMLIRPEARRGIVTLLATVGLQAELVAAAPASLRGTITLASGDPAIGAEVKLIDEDSRRFAAETRARADGSFVLTGLPSMRAHLEAELRGCQITRPDVIELVAGRTVEGIAIELPVSCRVEGMVTDEAGNPIAGMGVRHAQTKRIGDRTITDAYGRYVLDEIPPGEVELTLDESMARRPLTLAPGEIRKAVDFVLERATAASDEIIGRTVFEDGSPANDSWVHATRQGDLGGSSSHLGSANFAVKVRQPGTYDVIAFLLQADLARGHFEIPRSETAHVTPGSAAITLVITRVGSGAIEGRLVPDDGSAPPTDINVCLGIDEGGRSSQYTGGPCHLHDGLLRLTASAGEYTLVLEAAGLGKREIPVIVRANERTDLGEIRYATRPPWSGHVYDANGEPLADAYVGDLSFTLEGLDQAARTSANGAFSLPHRPLRYSTITAWKEGYAPLAWPSDPLDASMEFKLRPSGDLHVTNIPPYEERGGRWVLRAECQEPPEVIGQYPPMTNKYLADQETTELKLDRLPVGRWLVRFWKASAGHGQPPAPQPRESLRFEVEVRPGQTTTIDIGAHW
jgi:hypothetical protein